MKVIILIGKIVFPWYWSFTSANRDEYIQEETRYMKLRADKLELEIQRMEGERK